MAAGSTGTEFLTTFAISVPEGTPAQAVDDTEAREAQRAKELAGQGRLLRLWRLPGPSRALGLWNAESPDEMRVILKSLPMDPWMAVETTPLSRHPSDPAMIIA
jgi:muconolactone delta-isomerase